MDHFAEAEALLVLIKQDVGRRHTDSLQVMATCALAHATLAQKAAPVVTNVQNNAERALAYFATYEAGEYEHSAHPSIGDGPNV